MASAEINTGFLKDGEKQEMRINTDTITHVEEFVARYVNLELDKKTITDSMKDLKDDFKEKGLDVALISRQFKRVLKAKKMTDSQRHEEESILEAMMESKAIDEAIGKLV